MIPRNILTYLVNVFVYLFLQIALLNQLVIANIAFCFFYVGFLIYLPIRTSRITLLITGFMTGLLIDLFGDTLGMHMIACTLIMFIQPFWQQISLGDMSEISEIIGMKNLSIIRLAIYSLPLIVVHHLVLFIIDSIGTGFSFEIFFRVVLSTLFTFFVLIIIQLLKRDTKKRT